MSAEVLSIETAAQFERAVVRAADYLRAGQLVALPTETVYGLAANALDDAAVRRIFEVKGRPPENPIIVHVASLEMARRCVAAWPPAAEKLAGAFWPGPLTLVLLRSPEIPLLVTAGGSTVGVRWPRHPFTQAVIRACGFPLAAPSANPSNELSPTTAEHVRKNLGDKIPLIVDGGSSQVGIESSVLDLASTPPRYLRPGMISAQEIQEVMGETSLAFGRGLAEITRSPGQMPKHYSPKAKLRVLQWHDEEGLAAQVAQLGARRSTVHIISHSQVPLRAKYGRVAVMPLDAEAFARGLYAELHSCDAAGAEWIIVEALPAGEPWSAIADRLSRAANSCL